MFSVHSVSRIALSWISFHFLLGQELGKHFKAFWSELFRSIMRLFPLVIRVIRFRLLDCFFHFLFVSLFNRCSLLTESIVEPHDRTRTLNVEEMFLTLQLSKQIIWNLLRADWCSFLNNISSVLKKLPFIITKSLLRFLSFNVGAYAKESVSQISYF